MSDLEVLAPARVRWQEAERLGENESESPVVARITEQEDGWFVQGFGRGEHCVHECGPHPVPLLLREDAHRSQGQELLTVDVTTAAHDVSYYCGLLQGHERQLRYGVAVGW